MHSFKCLASDVHEVLSAVDSHESVSAAGGHHLIGAWVCGTRLLVVVLRVNLYPRTTTWRRVCSTKYVQTLPEGLVLGSSGPTLMGSPGSGGGVWTGSKGCFWVVSSSQRIFLCEGGCLSIDTTAVADTRATSTGRAVLQYRYYAIVRY